MGNVGDRRDPERLLEASMAAVVNLAAEEPSPNMPRSMIYIRFPIIDGEQDTPGILDVAIRTLVSLLQQRIPTLWFIAAPA